MRKYRHVWLAVACLFGSNGCASASPSAAPSEVVRADLCPADLELARLVGASTDIIVVTMHDPTASLEREVTREWPSYVEIALNNPTSLLGNFRANEMLRYYPQGADGHSVAWNDVSGQLGEPSLLFLLRIEEPQGLYFAGYTSDALQPATPETIALAEREVARQSAILAAWQPNESLPFYRDVEELIALLPNADAREQAQVFLQLEQLGEEAVPAIIHQMDNRSELRVPQISLRNGSPDAFEEMRHYGPETIVDALAAILNQITGQSFGQIHNGGTDAERDAAVAGWRIFAHDLGCPS